MIHNDPQQHLIMYCTYLNNVVAHSVSTKWDLYNVDQHQTDLYSIASIYFHVSRLDDIIVMSSIQNKKLS